MVLLLIKVAAAVWPLMRSWRRPSAAISTSHAALFCVLPYAVIRQEDQPKTVVPLTLDQHFATAAGTGGGPGHTDPPTPIPARLAQAKLCMLPTVSRIRFQLAQTSPRSSLGAAFPVGGDFLSFPNAALIFAFLLLQLASMDQPCSEKSSATSSIENGAEMTTPPWRRFLPQIPAVLPQIEHEVE